MTTQRLLQRPPSLIYLEGSPYCALFDLLSHTDHLSHKQPTSTKTEMALQPSLRDQLIIGDQNAPHTLEVWIDYVCPFCAKLFARGFPNGLLPLIKEGGKYHGKVKLLLRLQVQPWCALLDAFMTFGA
jgi:protein-disulfide isomerase